MINDGSYPHITSSTIHCHSLRAGLADPGPIASALWVDSELHSSVCLDSIVTVVDAHNLKKQLGEKSLAGRPNEAERQIAFADTVLLNKVWPALSCTPADQANSYFY